MAMMINQRLREGAEEDEEVGRTALDNFLRMSRLRG